MTYRIRLTPTAVSEAEQAYVWLLDNAPGRASQWHNGLIEKIDTLARHPGRCTRVPESDSFHEEIRQLFYGRRPGVYRILFRVMDDTVEVLHIRHGARAPVDPPDRAGS
jgi:plasmid stabilization system protein ParE